MIATALDAKHVYIFCTVPALIGAMAIALLRWRARPQPETARAV